jgi:penicillin-binding protein 1C
LLALPFALFLGAAVTPLPAELREGHYAESVRYFDRDGGLLREVRASDAARARWSSLEDVGPRAVEAVLAAEDRHFFSHPGVDPIAIVRALATSLWHRRVVSGASTLTMQLARLVAPRPRTFVGKLREMALALRIEASLSKCDILEQYMNRAPFGANLRGIDAASRAYFDKPPRALSLAEAAALAAIPRGPAVYAMAKHPERVVRRRDRILARMDANATATHDEIALARAEPLTAHLATPSFGAPHFVQALHDGALANAGGARARDAALETVTTTLDRALQRDVETAVSATLRPLARRHVTSASVVVLDNASGEILAYVGSPAFFDAKIGGQNDGVRAARQPGSTLKPFVYGLAFERLGYTPATLLRDVDTHIEGPSSSYAPRNYDERFHGPVRLRDALGSSLNVPAVRVAEELGIEHLLLRLREIGFASLGADAEVYGPALALGDGEVTLLELANAYATLARGGEFRAVRAIRRTTVRGAIGALEPAPTSSRRVMSAVAATMIEDILKDKNARIAAFGERSVLSLPFDVAAKTGTSKGFRDNWTVGFTRAVTVAVWVGNFDGSAMQSVSGITGAAPLFRTVMEAGMRGRATPSLGVDDASLFVGARVCPLSGGAATPSCPHSLREWVPAGVAAPSPCTMHERVSIDTRTGLRAGPSCPRSVVETRTFERYDAQLAHWAHSARRDMAPDAYSPLCPGARADGRSPSAALRIGYPNNGARFLLDADRQLAQQAVAVRLEVPRGSSHVVLKVDEVVVARVEAPYVARWPLARGEHVLVAEAGGASSEAVHIRVD